MPYTIVLRYGIESVSFIVSGRNGLPVIFKVGIIIGPAKLPPETLSSSSCLTETANLYANMRCFSMLFPFFVGLKVGYLY